MTFQQNFANCREPQTSRFHNFGHPTYPVDDRNMNFWAYSKSSALTREAHVHTISFGLFILTVNVGVVGCSGSNTLTPPGDNGAGGATAADGSAAETGGNAQTGGNSSTVVSATGGANAATGGMPNTGGSKASGGVAATGGLTSTGGMLGTGRIGVSVQQSAHAVP